MALVERAEIVGRRRRRHAREDARRRLDQRHGEALLAQHRRGLEADVAAADDQRPHAGADPRAESVCIGEVAHEQHARQIAPGLGRQAPRAGARGEGEKVVGKGASVGEADAPRRTVDRGGGRPGQELDAFALVEARRPQEQPLARRLALEVGLGERRPLVGRHRLAADESQRPAMPECAELRHERGAGLARTDDDDPRRRPVEVFLLHPSDPSGWLGPPLVYMSAVDILQPAKGPSR